MRGTIFLTLALLVGGCQTPTRVAEKDLELEKNVFSQIHFGSKEIDLSKAVIVDTRPRFAFELSKIPRSSHFLARDWDLFSLSPREQEKQREKMQRRLALKGIAPFTTVVVFGEGKKGKGEEFYIASVLAALGVKKIVVAPSQSFTKALTTRNVDPVRNVDYWSQPLVYSFSCTRKPSKVFGPIDRKQYLRDQYQVDGQSVARKLKPKKLTQLKPSADDFFIYGLALELLKKNYKVCIGG